MKKFFNQAEDRVKRNGRLERDEFMAFMVLMNEAGANGKAALKRHDLSKEFVGKVYNKLNCISDGKGQNGVSFEDWMLGIQIMPNLLTTVDVDKKLETQFEYVSKKLIERTAPQDKVFDLKSAKLLIEGKFDFEEDDDNKDDGK